MFVYILMYVLLQDNVIISLLKWHSFLLGKFSDPYSPKHEEEHPRKHNTPWIAPITQKFCCSIRVAISFLQDYKFTKIHPQQWGLV